MSVDPFSTTIISVGWAVKKLLDTEGGMKLADDFALLGLCFILLLLPLLVEVLFTDSFTVERRIKLTSQQLGESYQNRINGDRADNLEQSIFYYQEALRIFTDLNFSQQWALLQNKLGEVYQERIRGDRADNLEQSISCYDRALQVKTREIFPIEWALLQNSLGKVYQQRILGGRADNLEQSISCYDRALEILNEQDFPQDWALLQNSLGQVYQQRILGDRADNLEQSIFCYYQALQVLNQRDFPQNWARAKNNLAEAYILRLQLLGSPDHEFAEPMALQQTIELLQDLTTFFIEQRHWRNASSCYTLWAKALTYGKPDYGTAVTPLLLAIDLDWQHQPDLINTDIYELAVILPYLNWQPTHISVAWQNITHKVIETELLAKIYANVGSIVRSEGRWQMAIDYLTAAWQIYVKGEDLDKFAEINYQLGNTHHLMSNLNKAGMYYHDARRLFEHLDNWRLVSFCDHALARLLFQIGDIDRSIDTFNQAIAMYEQLPPEEIIKERIADAKYYLREIKEIYPALFSSV